MKNVFVMLLSGLFFSTLSSCTFPKPVAGGHPGMAILYGEPKERLKLNNVPVWIVMQKVDGRKINGRDAKLTDTGGLELAPGSHQVELSMGTPSDDPMVFGGGLIGAILAEVGKASEGPRVQTLALNAKGGADYIARHAFEKVSRGHVYWIEDYVSKAVVAGTRPPYAVPLRSPFADPATVNH